VLVLDVGLEAQASALDGNFYDLKNSPTAGLIARRADRRAIQPA
jgi:hypothetical protein